MHPPRRLWGARRAWPGCSARAGRAASFTSACSRGLAALGLRRDLIVGASAGAAFGALAAGGLAAGEIEALALELQAWQLVRVTFAGDTWLMGGALADTLRSRLGGGDGATPRLESLPVPLAVVAHRQPAGPAPGEVVAFTRGNVGTSVQASAAIEGQLAPVRIRGALYVDADLHMPLPVRVAHRLGATRVLAVDASAHEDKAPPGTEAWRAGDLRKRALTRPDAELADLLLRPDNGYQGRWQHVQCIATATQRAARHENRHLAFAARRAGAA